MNIDQFQDMTVPEFVRAVLPSLALDKVDEFSIPVELEKSQLHARMPYNTELFLFRNTERCEIHLIHNGRIINIAAQFITSPVEHQDRTCLPKIRLNSIQVGHKDALGQHIYEDAFYVSGHKPGLMENFRTRAYGQRVVKPHKLTSGRLRATCVGVDYAYLHLSAGITPALKTLEPLFSIRPLTGLTPGLGAAQLHRISKTGK